jgi:hypothetical protein
MARNRRSAHDNGRMSRDMAQDNSVQMRIVIAQAAAKLIAEGLTDHHAAKLKAARQLGITDSRALPGNREIEDALAQHLALFEGDSQPVALNELRRLALRLMQRLESFSPSLTGAVLAGTANEFSEIELELIGIEPKEFELFLLNAGVEHMLSEHVRAPNKSATQKSVREFCYACEYEGAPVAITLFENRAARETARPRNSIHHDRANYAEAKKRFDEI